MNGPSPVSVAGENRSCIAFDLSDQVLYRVWVGTVVDVVEVLDHRHISGGLPISDVARESHHPDLLTIVGEAVQVEPGHRVMTTPDLSHQPRVTGALPAPTARALARAASCTRRTAPARR